MNKPEIKKISMVLPFFADGGMERSMLNLSSGFLDHNIEIELILFKKGYGSLQAEIPAEVKVIELGAKNYFEAFFKLHNFLKNSDTDGILSFVTPTNLACIFSKLLRRSKYKLIVSTPITVSSDGRSSFIKKVLRHFIYRFYNFADVVHGVSIGVTEDLVKLGVKRRKVKTIYNPIVSPEILHLSEQMPPHEWFKQKEIPIILGMGRLVDQKDFPTLLRAFVMARKEKDLRLAILGEGPEREDLTQLAKELAIEPDFQLLGFSNNPYSYLKHASLFVLSSAWEGFGNVLAEAIALGVPAVSTNCPHGPQEILEDGKYGKLVPVGDVEGLAKAILETLAQPLSSEFLKQGGQRFTVEHVTNEYLKVFGESYGK